MNAEQEKFLRRIEGCATQSEVLEVVNDGVIRIAKQRDEAEADAKALAKHCVVVIKDSANGLFHNALWCTVCQARKQIPDGDKTVEFAHRDDCLVEKVMKEA